MSRVRLRVFEHERLTIGQPCQTHDGGETPFEPHHWEALARYVERTGSTAFRVGYRSIVVGHHVGYLQVGSLRLEILPKLGQSRNGAWRDLLLHMLSEVTGVRLALNAPSPLASRHGELYWVLMDRFLTLTEQLVREGLARSYREVEENGPRFRGRLLVSKHLRANVAHAERFHVSYEVWDSGNLPNQILVAAVESLRRQRLEEDLGHRSEALAQELQSIEPRKISPADFERLRLDRRTFRYREALELARLVLLQQRPDLRWSDGEVSALLFDMNHLFEAYIARQVHCLQRVRVRAQASRLFWQSNLGGNVNLQPDLVIWTREGVPPLIIDTKWKIPNAARPAEEDLRQLHAYLETFEAHCGLLLYPHAYPEQVEVMGHFTTGVDRRCGMAYVDLLPGDRPDAHAVRAQLQQLLERLSPTSAGH